MTTNELKQIETLLGKLLADFAVKYNLENVVTKNDVRGVVKEELVGFATKQDLEKFATKEDLQKLATKEDLEKVKKYLENEIAEMGKEIIESADRTFISKKTLKKLFEN